MLLEHQRLPPLKVDERSGTRTLTLNVHVLNHRGSRKKAVDAYHGGNPRMCWWKSVCEKLKMEAFQIILMMGSPDSVEMYRKVIRAATKTTAKVKAKALEFG